MVPWSRGMISRLQREDREFESRRNHFYSIFILFSFFINSYFSLILIFHDSIFDNLLVLERFCFLSFSTLFFSYLITAILFAKNRIIYFMIIKRVLMSKKIKNKWFLKSNKKKWWIKY